MTPTKVIELAIAARKAGAVLSLCVAMAIAAPAQTFTTLFSFNGTDGATSAGSLIQGFNGNFYGTTQNGGAGSGCNGSATGCGTVFEITPSGELSTLYNFCLESKCGDGWGPQAGLVQATNGNFYGTATYGGLRRYSGCGAAGCGTVFKINPAGNLRTLYNFCSQPNCTDGFGSFAALAQADNGNFYGTTFYGGANNATGCGFGCGTVFEITPAGALTTLYSFCSQPGCTDGMNPIAGLVWAYGNFYGTTTIGGANGEGTVFEITPEGKLTTLYSFCSLPNCADGSDPYGELVHATNGTFYGTTLEGGANGVGTVFKMIPAGKLTTLYSFCSQPDCADGYGPTAGLVQATDDNFYGTTRFGGNRDACDGSGCGTIFEVMPAAGTLTTLYTFCPQSNCTDGSEPYASLLQSTNGILYGTTFYGGDDTGGCGGLGCGTVFSESVGLQPFIEALPQAGKVGAGVIILGNNLEGAAAVSFQGTAAAFTVVSATEIKTSVPSGARSGPVSVTTSEGRLFTRGFQVLP